MTIRPDAALWLSLLTILTAVAVERWIGPRTAPAAVQTMFCERGVGYPSGELACRSGDWKPLAGIRVVLVD